jgi:hypothetical protein
MSFSLNWRPDMRRRIRIAAGAVVVMAGTTLWADVLRVPSQYPTIQSGVDAASPGDTVLIADGVYTGPGNKNLDFGGKGITVESENGRENCIIDCERDGRAFYFHSDEGPDSIVRGLTIRNGQEFGPFLDGTAGAILCFDAAPLIAECLFLNNQADVAAAIDAEQSDIAVVDCAFIDNGSTCGGIGAISTRMGNPMISHCDFRGNSARGCGSGGSTISCFGGSPAILDAGYPLYSTSPNR